nr:phage antirepressor N-terminal domain-containing protein [Arsenophonus endosymbiont of Apis mellifera]
MNNAISTINVSFYGDDLYVVNYNNEPYVPMKPIVEGMGLDWKSQFVKIKQRFKSTMVEITMVAGDGKERSMICLALRKLAGWLSTISPNKVKAEIRDKVVRYQDKCDDVLYEYWMTGEVRKKEDKLLVLNRFSGESGRILITIKNNQIYRTDMVLENEHLLTLDSFLTSSPTFTLRDSGGGFPLVGDYLIAQKPGSCC